MPAAGVKSNEVGDIFLSYNSPDRPLAARLARVFECQAWNVWWDRKITPGQSYDAEIEQSLIAARAVVVLWSKTAITSEWVRAEAELAAERRVLLPARIDDVQLPLRFRLLQTADLTEWKPGFPHKGLDDLLTATSSLIEKSIIDLTPRLDAQGHYEQGLELEASGNTEQATSSYASALRLDPDFAPALARFHDLIKLIETTLPRGGVVVGRDIEFGTVDWFNMQKGFGFIRPDAEGGPVFIHVSALERQLITRHLEKGQRVAYLTLAIGTKKAAQNVRVL